MNKNVVTFTTERGEGKGFTLPIKNLHEGDVIDASKITQRELSFGWASATTASHSFPLEGKNITIEIYKGSTRYSVTRYGDVVSLTTYQIPVGTTRIIVKGSVTYLDLYSIGINTLDVTKMPCLEHLECHSNVLNSLDLSKNVALDYLNCGSNQLTSLDVTNNVALTTLYCSDAQLTSLDLPKNGALTELNCGVNLLTSLDVSKNVALTALYCDGNQLTSLDLSKNVVLTGLYCNTNQLTSFTLPQFKDYVEIVMGNNPLVADYASATAWLDSLPKQNVSYDEHHHDIYINDDDLAEQIGEDYVKGKGYAVYGEY